MSVVLERSLTCSEVARIVSPVGGTPVHPATVSRWCLSGKMRCVKAGRRILIPESAVPEFLEAEAERWRERNNVSAPVRSKSAGDRAAEEAAADLGVVME